MCVQYMENTYNGKHMHLQWIEYEYGCGVFMDKMRFERYYPPELVIERCTGENYIAYMQQFYLWYYHPEQDYLVA